MTCGVSVRLREDFSADGLRALAARSKDGPQAHRGTKRTTQMAKGDIRDIGAPHTGLIGLTGPWGRCT